MSQDLEMVQSFRRMSRCSSTFFPLPTDILLYMVQFFSFEQKRSIRLVSKQFRLQADKSIKLSLGLEELISRRLFVELRLSNEFLGNIPRGLKVLKILSRSSIGNLGIQCLPPYLEWLELDECMIDDQGLEYLPRSLQVFHLKDSPNLREFWIRGANFVDGALLHMPQHITNFGVMACPNLTTKCFQYLPENLKEILVLNCQFDSLSLQLLPRKLQVLKVVDYIQCTGLRLESSWKNLPPNLTYLLLVGLEMTGASLKLLPFSLTRLDLFTWNDNDFLETFPTNLKTLVIGGDLPLDKISWPQNLEFLGGYSR